MRSTCRLGADADPVDGKGEIAIPAMAVSAEAVIMTLALQGEQAALQAAAAAGARAGIGGADTVCHRLSGLQQQQPVLAQVAARFVLFPRGCCCCTTAHRGLRGKACRRHV